MSFIQLLCLSAAMFASSLAAGLLPLFFALSARRVRYMTTVGVGLLVGVAFIVIIPEGVHTYYAPDTASHGHSHSDGSSLAAPASHWQAPLASARNVTAPATPPAPQPPAAASPLSAQHRQPGADGSSQAADGGGRRPVGRQLLGRQHGDEQAQQPRDRQLEPTKQQRQPAASESASPQPPSPPRRQQAPCVAAARDSSRVGMALVAGFVLMLLVDRASGGHDGHSHGSGATAAGGGGASGAGSGAGRQWDLSKSSSGQGSGAQKLSDGGHEMNEQTAAPAAALTPILASVANHPSAFAASAASPKLSGAASLAGTAANPSTGHTALLAASSPAAAAAPASLHSPPPGPSASSLPSPGPATSVPASASSSASASASASSAAPAASAAPLPSSALLGILTHSAIDGLALGAISVSDNRSLELVVFVAIVLHKAPAAFGLASFLLYQGRSRAETRWHLFVFSLAAPVTSVLTYLLFLQRQLVSGAAAGSGGVSSEWLGLCLLFSAGTFLFTIAAHILPEVSRKEGELIEWRYVLCLIVGILMPLALNTSHHH